ncbi:MAG TPA: response regulator [Gammaproteobacteria bacterium]|nr:response regulator [Gammaproteobacteria bacterium]
MREQISVLIVEDNPICLKVASLVNSMKGHDITSASTAKGALDLCKQAKKPFDLIFMDIGLPDMEGTLLTREIRQVEGFSHTVIIALSAHILSQEPSLNQYGFNEVCEKPLTKQLLEKLLFNHFAQVQESLL